MLDLEMRQLEYFVTAASAGSYSQAAKQLFVSPQAISKGVKMLESRLGITLFERGPNGIALTSFGKTFYKESEAVIRSLERLQDLAEQHLKDYSATLSVGIHSLCFKEHGGSIDWNDLLEFQETNQDLAPNFIEMRGDSTIESVNSGALDFGISVLPRKNPHNLESRLLKRFSLSALVSKGYGYFNTQDQISIKELIRGQLVLFSEDREFNNFFLEKAESENLTVDISSLQIRTDSDIDFVLSRKLYVVRPHQHATRTNKSNSVHILPIVDAQGNSLKMPLHLFWKKGRKLTPLEETFITLISELYQ